MERVGWCWLSRTVSVVVVSWRFVVVLWLLCVVVLGLLIRVTKEVFEFGSEEMKCGVGVGVGV